MTWNLISLVEHNAELKTLLEKAILQAKNLNPDPMTNPVSDLDSYYALHRQVLQGNALGNPPV